MADLLSLLVLLFIFCHDFLFLFTQNVGIADFSSFNASCTSYYSSIPKSTARDGRIPGISSGKTSWNSFTMGTVSIVFSFPFVFTAQARIVHPPCYTRRLAFIIDIIFGVVPVKVPLNLKVSPFGGVNTTSFLWQSMLAKFLASQSIPSMTSKFVISTTFRSTWMVLQLLPLVHLLLYFS